jgi:hypothetical protein
MLGDLAEATNLPGRNLQSILNAVGLSSDPFTLANFGVVDKQTIGTMLNAMPSLSSVALGDVAPLYDLVQKELGNTMGSMFQNTPLGEILNMDEIAVLSLDALDLSKYGLDAIPGLLNADLEDFAQWGSTLIGEIPGLADLPFAEFFTDLGLHRPFALVDIVFGEKEAQRTNTVTGSNVVGFSYPCEQDNCAHIELAGPDWLGATFLQGKQWISGDSQWVSGGSGCLAGEEPTGRLPFGKGFKVVLTGTNEAEGLAEFGIYFRFSIFCGKSPYIIGPFPWMSQYEKDPIFLGFD